MKPYPRTEIINKIIRENMFSSYLEIGLGNGHNFHLIQLAHKTGVDPAFKDTTHKQIAGIPSDEFFDLMDTDEISHEKFDLIFVDGLHHSDQVERDIVNSYRWLNDNGMILIHDVDPPNEKASLVPRSSHMWMGDVYRAVFGFMDKYDELIDMAFIKERAGIFAIRKNPDQDVELGFNYPDMSFKEFRERRSEMVLRRFKKEPKVEKIDFRRK